MTMQVRWIALPAAVLFLSVEALAIDLPKRKSGLWDVKITHDGSSGPPQTMQMCIDQKTDDMAQQMGANVAKQACSKQDIRREGGKIVGDRYARSAQPPRPATRSSAARSTKPTKAKSVPNMLLP
jgi:hypothetical protein